MKTAIVAPVLWVAMLSTAGAQQPFTVSGQLTGISSAATIFLSYTSNGTSQRDSLTTTNGSFRFAGTVPTPTKAYLEVKLPPANVPAGTKRTVVYDGQSFFLEKGQVKVTGSSAKTASITGGATQAEYTILNRQLQPFLDQQAIVQKQWQQQWKNPDTTGRAAMQAQFSSVSNNMTRVNEDFIRAYPHSFVSLDLLLSRANYIDPATFGPLYEGLSTSLKNTEAGENLGERLNIARKTAIGNPAINFTQNTKDGQPFTLYSLKGKYVLVDFWASWCGPCRAENPYVLKAYETFKDKNFEIVSISLDEKKEPWLKAIEKDSLPWIHISDLKGWHNDVAVTYGIRAIPRNLLLDPNGIIIAKNLRGDEVIVKLREVIR